MPFPRPEFLRSLFPSWRFFNRPGEFVHLSVRTRSTDGTWEDWRSWESSAAPFVIFKVFFNPSGNRRLYFESLKDRLVDLLSELGEEKLSRSHAYRTLLSCLKEEIAYPFQFRLEVGTEPVLISEVVER